MDFEDLEANLNATIEELYNGLTDLATETRSNDSRDDLADRMDRLASDICRHWPTCRAAHGMSPPTAAKTKPVMPKPPKPKTKTKGKTKGKAKGKTKGKGKGKTKG